MPNAPYWQKSVGPLASQIGWAPTTGTNSNTLTLMPAGHAAGMYEIAAVVIVRTTGTGTTFGSTVTWNSPTFGAESKGYHGALNWGTSGTAMSGNAGNTSPREAMIVSDGSAAIQIQFNAGTISAGSPVADVYAVAWLVRTL